MTLVFAPRSPCPFTELGRFEGRNHAPRRKGMMALRPRGGVEFLPSLSLFVSLFRSQLRRHQEHPPTLSLSLSLSRRRRRRAPRVKESRETKSWSQEETRSRENLLQKKPPLTALPHSPSSFSSLSPTVAVFSLDFLSFRLLLALFCLDLLPALLRHFNMTLPGW